MAGVSAAVGIPVPVAFRVLSDASANAPVGPPYGGETFPPDVGTPSELSPSGETLRPTYHGETYMPVAPAFAPNLSPSGALQLAPSTDVNEAASSGLPPVTDRSAGGSEIQQSSGGRGGSAAAYALVGIFCFGVVALLVIRRRRRQQGQQHVPVDDDDFSPGFQMTSTAGRYT